MLEYNRDVPPWFSLGGGLNRGIRLAGIFFAFASKWRHALKGKAFACLVFLWLICWPSNAQHPYYQQLLKDGRLAMSSGNLDQAEQFLEIAAFGLLNEPEQLREIYIRLILIQRRNNNLQRSSDYQLRLNRLGSVTERPNTLPEGLWQEFQQDSKTATEEEAQPNGNQGGAQLNLDKPEQLVPPVEQLQQLTDRRRWREARRLAARLIEKHGSDITLLNAALLLESEHGKNEYALDYANKIVSITADHALAHEVLGSQAVREGRHGLAAKHFAMVSAPVLDDTAGWMIQNQQALAEEQADPLPSPGKGSMATSDVEIAADAPPEPGDVAAAGLMKKPETSRHPLAEISTAMKSGKLRKAKRMIRRYPEAKQNEPDYLDIMAELLFLREEYNELISSFNGRENVPDKASYYVGRGFIALNNPDQAREWLKDLPNDRFPDIAELLPAPSPPDTVAEENQQLTALQNKVRTGVASENDFVALLRASLLKEEWREVRRVTKRFLDAFPQNQHAHYGQARLDLQDGRLEDASRGFYNLSKNGFRDGEIDYFGGVAAYANGEISLAKYMFVRAKNRNSAYLEDIQAYLIAMRHPVKVELTTDINAHIQFLTRKIERNDEIEARLALMRLYYVTDQFEPFRIALSELTGQDNLGSEQRAVIAAWQQIAMSNYSEALNILKDQTGNEAQFVKGYLLLRENKDPDSFWNALLELPNFPEIQALLTP